MVKGVTASWLWAAESNDEGHDYTPGRKKEILQGSPVVIIQSVIASKFITS